jgi:S1-C subfamily serine protease
MTRALNPDEVFEAAKPAVVMVEADNSVTWSVPFPEITPPKQKQLQDRLVAMVLAGQVANTDRAIGAAEVRLLTDNPAAWFSVGTRRHEQTDTVFAVGSGFFVTEDGYLLTNDHVVETSDEEVKKLLLGELDQESRDPQALQQFRDDMSRNLGATVTDQQAAKLFQWLLSVSKSDVRLTSVKPTFRIGFGSMSVQDVRAHGVPVELLAHGAAIPDRDVAVMKASGGPYVSVAVAPSAPARDAAADVVGYPCRCADEAALDPGRPLSPVLTHGTFQERLLMPTGWTALGTDAHIEHGNSGGPVFDGSGRVVGLATFVDSATNVGQRSFAVPMDVARQFTGQARVRPAQGAQGQQYAQAVAEFRQQHYRAALPLFQRVGAATRHNPYAQKYATDSLNAIAAGRDRTPPPIAGAVPYLLAAAYLVATLGALVAGLALLVRHRRRRRAFQ